MHHFFVGKENIKESEIRISGDDFFHAVKVLRLKKNEKVLVSDEEGNDYSCMVDTILEKSQLILKVIEKEEKNHELKANISLYQSLPKSDKMEQIIKHATELGVTTIIPVYSKNCVVKYDRKKETQKLERWETIVKEAAKQSKRSKIPVISHHMKFIDAVKDSYGDDIRLMAYEGENDIKSMCEAIISFLPGRRISIFVGPEGGFDKIEAEYAKSHGVIPVSLGKRILRTETASLALLSLIMMRLEIVDGLELTEDV